MFLAIPSPNLSRWKEKLRRSEIYFIMSHSMIMFIKTVSRNGSQLFNTKSKMPFIKTQIIKLFLKGAQEVMRTICWKLRQILVGKYVYSKARESDRNSCKGAWTTVHGWLGMLNIIVIRRVRFYSSISLVFTMPSTVCIYTKQWIHIVLFFLFPVAFFALSQSELFQK